jgi:Tol biopolymer transport system component
MSDPQSDLVERNIERLVRAAGLPRPESRLEESFQSFLQRAAAPPARKWPSLLPLSVVAAMLLAVVFSVTKPAGPDGRPGQASATPEEIRRFIRDLGSDEFATREKATEKLRALGTAAQASLVAALKETSDAEARARILELLRPLEILAACELACGGPDGRILLQTADGSVRRSIGPVMRTQGRFRCVWSPDGKWLAYASGGELHVLELLTDADRLLVGSIGTMPVWSPDSAWLAYRANDGSVLVRVADGRVRRLDHTGTPCGWSSDGGSLYLNNFGPGLIRMDLKTLQTTPLLESTAFAFAMDGTKVYYHGKSDGQESYQTMTYPLMSSDLRSGRMVTLMPLLPQAGAGMIALSPDGKKLAFTKTQRTSAAEREKTLVSIRTVLCIVNTDGSDEKIIGVMDVMPTPSWSPDGTRLAFQRDDRTVIHWIDTGRETTLEGSGPAWYPLPPTK